MRSLVNKWELWKDGTYRLTTKSDLLHLIVWKDGDGWYYNIVYGRVDRAEKTVISKKPLTTLLEAQQICAKLAIEILHKALKGLEAAGFEVSKV